MKPEEACNYWLPSTKKSAVQQPDLAASYPTVVAQIWNIMISGLLLLLSPNLSRYYETPKRHPKNSQRGSAMTKCLDLHSPSPLDLPTARTPP